MKRILALLFIAAAIAAFFAFGLNEVFSLSYLKEQQVRFAELRADAPVATAATFFVLYVLVAAASLPGAAVLSLAAGALFGTLVGLVIVSFAASIGATIAMLIARYLLRDFVQGRGVSLKGVNDGMAKNGAFYLFTLRLVPVAPFLVVNLLMGLTTIPARTFYWVSQVGMLPGGLVYVNAGTQLGMVESLGDIGSPAVIGSFVLLGLFPWVVRGILIIVSRRKVYRGYKRPKRFDRNLVVIGAGAAGLVSAYVAATVKAKVTLVEARRMGGDCLNFGCVPSKALIKSAKVAHEMRTAARYGLRDIAPVIDFYTLMQRVRAVITAIEPHDSIARYSDLGVDVVAGHATIVDPWTVSIRRSDGWERRLTTRAIVIASGAAPVVPPLPGLEDTGYVTSDTMWESLAERHTIPRRMVVLGGGPIGCELAQAFARLGAEVTQVEMADRLLIREDDDVSALARAVLEGEGVRVLTGHKALRTAKRDGEKVLSVEAAGRTLDIPFDELLVAVGRAARLKGYGLETLDIDTDRVVTTNPFLQTKFPNIYAAGDVAGPYQFTHAASHQAWHAAVNALFGFAHKFKVDYSVLPAVTFMDPEIARVGLNEREATAQNIAYEVTRYPVHELDRAIAESSTRGFIKVLTVPGKDRILGVTIACQNAGEIIAEYVLAMRHGLGLNKIMATVHSYPTISELNKYAAGEWKRAHAPQKLLALVERFHTWRRN